MSFLSPPPHPTSPKFGKLRIYGHWFNQRRESIGARGTTSPLLGIWNKLLKKVASAGTITAYKRHLNIYIDIKVLAGDTQLNRASLDGASTSHDQIESKSPFLCFMTLSSKSNKLH